MTSGMESASQATVMLEAVWDHAGDEAALVEFDTARLARDFEDGESSGAGDAVELRNDLRGEPLVGDCSGGGNSPGC